MPYRTRSRALPAWRDPEQVYLGLVADAPVSAWLDSGADATRGTSVIAVPRDGTARVVHRVGDGSPAEVIAALRDGIAAHPASAVEPRDVEADDDGAGDGGASRSPLGWIGWLGYEFGATALGLPAAATDAPDAAFFFADRAIVFDHGTRRVRLEWLEAAGEASAEASGAPTAAEQAAWADTTAATIAGLPEPGSADADGDADADADAGGAPAAPATDARWRHAPGEYRELIRACQAAIVRGDAYQLCLTNRVDVAGRFDPVASYLRVRRTSPSHHGGLLRFGDVALVSASPEQFLLVEPDGTVSTKPMKGTRPRGADPVSDAALRDELLASEKERAENLMIVDLMRNDLARVAELGSVRVTGLHEVEQYRHVHQLVSTVSARLRHPFTAVDAVAAAFPAGSMTGAPKESAMRILHALERGPRGVYSGAFGCLGIDGGADLAMVIRSIVITPEGASIGTGGGITALSVPDEEVEETRVKARALIAALGAAASSARIE